MRWSPGGRSSDIEDRRGSGGFPGGGMGMGIGGTLVMLVLSLIFGRDFVGGSSGGAGDHAQTSNGQLAPADSAREEPQVQFVSFVIDSVQNTWARLLPQYHPAKLVLYRDYTPTGCGTGQAAMGPFYCPVDQKVYLDLGFFEELRTRFRAPGEFAEAYVIAHELGHHVQNLLGTASRLHRAQQENPDAANALSVRLELQADCYAGVWGHVAAQQGLLDPGEAQQGLDAAAAVGDDRLQREATGHVNTDAFTHGSSAQRMEWFQRGMQSGDPRQCDTFRGR